MTRFDLEKGHDRQKQTVKQADTNKHSQKNARWRETDRQADKQTDRQRLRDGGRQTELRKTQGRINPLSRPEIRAADTLIVFMLWDYYYESNEMAKRYFFIREGTGLV